MAKIEQVIEVNVPIGKVYEQMTRFEEFPRFMQGVHSVHPLDDAHLHWRAEIGGKETEWDAEITEKVAGKHISWRNTTGPKSEGKVSFEALAPAATRITLVMEAEEAALRHPDMKKSKTPRDDHDLARFKKMIEQEQQSSAAGSEGSDLAEIGDIGQSAASYSGQASVETPPLSAGGASAVETQASQGQQGPQAAKQEAPSVGGSGKQAARATDNANMPLRAGRRNIDREFQSVDESKTAESKAIESKPAHTLSPSFTPFLQAWEDPFGLMRRMGEEMEEFFERWGGRAISPWLQGRGAQGMRDWAPPLDIAQHGSQWVICADLPGIKKEDVQVEIGNGLLTITGERHADQTQVRQSSRRSERYHGYFCRSVDLPEGVDPNAAQASMHDGVLEITLPLQAQAAQGKRVAIQPSGQ